MNGDGRNPKQLTDDAGVNDDPFVSPGGEPVRLTESNTHSPALSPDGVRIAYFYRDESVNGRYRICHPRLQEGSLKGLLMLRRGLSCILCSLVSGWSIFNLCSSPRRLSQHMDAAAGRRRGKVGNGLQN